MDMKQMAELLGSAFVVPPGVPVLFVHPGDTLVVEVDGVMSQDQANYLRKAWQDGGFVPQGVKVLVNDSRLKGPLRVIRNAAGPLGIN